MAAHTVPWKPPAFIIIIPRKASFNQYLVAYVGLSNVTTEVSELQIMVMREHQGNGYATELLTALIPYLFKKYSFDRIVYRLRANNVPSEKLVKKLGGVIQKPNSVIEELTVKTYHIVRTQ